MQQGNAVHLLPVGIFYEELPGDGEETCSISEDNGFAQIKIDKDKR
jgi:hypothetical protein